MSTDNSAKQRVEFIPVNRLKLDPENPRIPSTINRTSESEILRFMARKANVVELMGSIGQVGFFPGEPLLAIGPDDKEMYTVIEGNRRLAAVKLLLNPDLDPTRSKRISQTSAEAVRKDSLAELPVLVYPSRDDIVHYLGYRHITGVQAWSSLAKARYLRRLLDRQKKNISDREQDIALAKAIGSRSDHVGRLLASLATYEVVAANNFFDIPNLGEETIDFGVWATVFNYGNLVSFLGLADARDRILADLDLERLEELVRWLFKTDDTGSSRIRESRDLAKLNSVIGSEVALREFRNGLSLWDAYELTLGTSESFLYSLSTAKSSLRTALQTIQKLTEATEEEKNSVAELMILLEQIQQLLLTK